jgi:hypothetical protein
MLALLLSPLASAQRPSAPTFGLEAPSSSCTGAQPGYTCTGSAQVTDYSPTYCGIDCHYEFCFSKTETDGYADCAHWFEGVPATISLGNNLSNGLITILSEYRKVVGTTIGLPSQYGTASITLIETAPDVSVNSPAGILGSDGSLLQTQLINGYVGQYVTYHAASTGGGTVSVSFEPCVLSPSSCGSSVDLPQTQFIDPPAPATYTLPSVWSGWTPGTATAYDYVQLSAEDEASNTSTTPTPGSAPFGIFDGSSTNEGVACTPAACTDLADGTGENGGAGDIPGDPPSQADSNGNVFSGYADPTIRADTLVTSDNPDGANLWMGYSWPFIQTFPNSSTTVGTIESHLAQSSTINGVNGGASWTVWCSAGSNCSGPTPIYPSVQHGDGVNDPYHFSSHEVLNLWPYIVQPGSGNNYAGTETWYAAHLMYFRYKDDLIESDIQTYGCLVVATTNTSQNTQDSPGQLNWPVSTDPSHCTDTPPSNSVFLHWATLNTLASSSSNPPSDTCYSWGEPAIMVSSDGGTLYLAASCFNESFVGEGYWIFTVPTSEMLTESDWTLFDENFSYPNLPSSLQMYVSGYGTFSYLTEFDWAMRADGSLAAVVTPAGTGTPGQFGCVALDFTLQSGTSSPFGSFWATVTDADTSGPDNTSETNGPNGCTYEPGSNHGVVIVRNLIGTPPPTVKTYSIVNSGLIP